MSVEFSRLQTQASSWKVENCKVVLNCCLEACIVPSHHSLDGVRLDNANLVVLDNFFDEETRLGLLRNLGAASAHEPPSSKWDRNTADGLHAATTWGLKESVLQELAANPSPAMLEIQTHLAKLYPEYSIAHMPSSMMQSSSSEPPGAQETQQCKAQGAVNSGEDTILAEEGMTHRPPDADCCSLLANAPVHGDSFTWHVDADPLTLPDCSWRKCFGDYRNREPGLPLLVSLLLYLVDDSWDPNYHAETLFLDTSTDVGIVVRPRRYRAVIMDQDVMHRVVAPSRLAGNQPRYSLVWKLAFLPTLPSQVCSIRRPEWGKPSFIGSAAQMERAKQNFMLKKQ